MCPRDAYDALLFAHHADGLLVRSVHDKLQHNLRKIVCRICGMMHSKAFRSFVLMSLSLSLGPSQRISLMSLKNLFKCLSKFKFLEAIWPFGAMISVEEDKVSPAGALTRLIQNTGDSLVETLFRVSNDSQN